MNTYYMVHIGMKRKEYADRYLIPSLVDQGIPKNRIIRIVDINKEGCLEMYIKAYLELGKLCSPNTGVWHIQDDVIISRQFKELTEKNNKGVVCGFCSGLYYDRGAPGYVNVQDMWYSSPCIRIPVKYSTHFVAWLEQSKDKEVIAHKEINKGEDLLFKKFMCEMYPLQQVLNLAPNPVDHIDYLIGWSTVNQQRGKTPVTSIYWDEQYRIDALKMRMGMLS